MRNVEKIRQIYAAFGRGEIPTILEQLSDTVEWDYGTTGTDVPWLQARRGRAGVQKFFEAIGQFELHKFEPKEFLEGNNLVVVLIDVDLTVKATGIRVVEEDEVHVWHFDSEGKVSRFAHKLDTHQHWAAFKGEVAETTLTATSAI